MVSVSHRRKPLVSFVSASSLSSNSARLYPNRDKGIRISALWWSGALRNLIVELRREGYPTRLHFSRGVVVGRAPQTPFAAFYYFLASSHHHHRRLLLPFKEISRLFQFPLILPTDRRGSARGDPFILYRAMYPTATSPTLISGRVSKNLS